MQAVQKPVQLDPNETVKSAVARLARVGLRISPVYTGDLTLIPLEKDSELARANAAKLARAKAALGDRWVLHPDYKATPRHSNVPEIYGPARAALIDDIKARAQRDREANPMYQRAEGVRTALNLTEGA